MVFTVVEVHQPKSIVGERSEVTISYATAFPIVSSGGFTFLKLK